MSGPTTLQEPKMPAHSRSQPAQITILENARIYTMDRDLPVADAIALQNGRLLAVGSAAEVAGLGDKARRINLGGRAVIPGLIDAHIHFLDYSRSLKRVNLDGVRSKEEVLALVAEKVRQT